MTPTPEEYDLAHRICRIATTYRDEGRGVTLMVMERMPEPPASLVAARLIAAHTAPLRELAEIGRLAVERELVWRTPLGDVDGKIIDGIESAMRHDIDAYLAKHPTEKP